MSHGVQSLFDLTLKSEWDSLCFPGAAADLGYQKIDPKGSVLVVEETLQFCNLLAEHIGCVADTPDDAKATCVCDGCCELGSSSYIHTGEHDWVVDLEEVGDRGAELLWDVISY